MEEIRGYILSIAAAAMIISMLSSMTKGGGMIKLVGGIVLLIVLIQPVAEFRFEGLESYLEDTFSDGERAAEEGNEIAKNKMADIIRAETEAYILDKAGLYDTRIEAQVRLSNDEIPCPVGVTITGIWSDTEREKLEELIESELGIPKENQIWTGGN